VTDLIARLGLSPHPEGGHYRQIFKSPFRVAPASSERSGGGAPHEADVRSALTAIYFLLQRGEQSRWHRVTSDEVWTHLEGDGVRLHLFDGERVTQRVVGPFADSADPVVIVPAGVWQAAEPLGDHALVACFVAPGFEFDDFTLMADDRDAAARLGEVDRALLRLV